MGHVISPEVGAFKHLQKTIYQFKKYISSEIITWKDGVN
jgi:hypothetical protein